MSDPPGFSEHEIVVLSPHLDDAALSAWHVVAEGRHVSVVTVFAGLPSEGILTDLDRAHGAVGSAHRMQLRRRQDVEALAVAGCRVVHLGLPEVQFAAHRSPEIRHLVREDPARFLEIVRTAPELAASPAAVLDAVQEHITPDAVVHGPVGIGGHPDHVALARAVVQLTGRVRAVHLYADSPYFLFGGVPPWATGAGDVGTGDRVAAGLAAHPGLTVSGPAVTVLTDPELDAKLDAISRYTTEMPSLLADLRRAGESPRALRYEASWTVTGVGARG